MIYLDSAATTLQKPPAVASATRAAVETLASPGRGGYPAAMMAAQVAYDCREQAARIFHVQTPDQVVFTMNATHALNFAIHSLVSAGDKVVISGYEHNAVTRALESIPQLCVEVAAAPLFDQAAIVDAFERALLGGAQVAICIHVSNVFGYVLPIEKIAALCARYAVPLIVDASQSAGSLPVDMQALNAAFVAMPAHKGLFGPQGVGLLLCNKQTTPLIYGGTGSESIHQAMPEYLPDRLEAGTHNMPGIAGLLAGMRYVEKKGLSRILAHERRLIAQAADLLCKDARLRVFYGGDGGVQGGVLSFCVEGYDCELLAQQLGERGIAVRAGLHCAPTAHRTAGTLESGTVRISVSPFNTEKEIGQFAAVLKQILK